MLTKLIILDRDGVINQDSDDFIKAVAEWIPLPGALQSIGRLTSAGYTIAIATNQSGLARGLFDIDALNRIHQTMRLHAGRVGGRIGAIVFCPHGPDSSCECRKPKPGLLHELARRYSVSLLGVPVVGDSLRDLEAAVAVGATPILVRTGKGQETEATLPREIPGLTVHANLEEAADYILKSHISRG